MVLNKTIHVEVAYALPERQSIIAVEVEEGCTIADAINRSGILAAFSEVDFKQYKVGVFSKPRKLSDPLQAGDRVEIYRSLIIDPKEARRTKAKKK